MDKKNKYFIQNGMISKFDFMDNQEFLPLETVCNLLNKQDDQYDNLREKCVLYAEHIDEQHQRIEMLEKALELACDTAQFEDTCDYCAYQGELEITKQCPCFCETDEKCFKTQAVGYFIEKAKEMMKSE